MPQNLELKNYKQKSKFNFRKMVIANSYRALDYMYSVLSSSYQPYMALSIKLQLSKIKNSVLQSTSHISRAQQPYMPSGYGIGHRYKTFYDHTVLLDNTDVY